MNCKRCGAVAALALGCAVFVATNGVAQDSKSDTKLTPEQAKKLKNPIPYTQKSLDAGKVLFRSNCTDCHGADGKAEAAIIANATDLTSPNLYKHGTTEGEIFHSIKDGAGDQMPAFGYQLSGGDPDIWNLVNYVRSLWPESLRPKLPDAKK